MKNPLFFSILICLFLGIIFCLIFGYFVEVNRLKFETNNKLKSGQNESQIWLPQLP